METQECAWCGEDSTICCNSCSEVWYCSKQHQQLHWYEHYRECKLYKMKSSDNAGRYLAATRSIKSGATIFVDDPLVIGPLGTSDILCLTCHSPIYEEEFYKCPSCSWPMCSQKCAADDAHDAECDVLSLDKNHCGVPHSQGVTPRFDLIMILRCLLLKQKDPEKWKVVLSMVSHAEERKEEQEPHQMAAVRFFTEICKGDWDEDTVHHVRGVILTNSFEIRGPAGMHLRVLYPLVRLFNHSCLPNVHLSANTESRMEAKAAIDIKKGDELFISYCGTDVPIWERHAYLATVHYFDCVCERCSDPSELGTMFSSSRCPLCPKEIMKPSIVCGELIWTCPKCGMENSATEISQEIEEWIFRLEMNEFFGTGSPHKISHALALIEQHFHIKHYMWLRTAQAALQKMLYDSSYAALKVKKYIWEKILDIYSAFEPGLTRRRGMALLEVGKAAFNMSNTDFLKKGEISIYQVESFLRESKRAFLEAYNILRTEPTGTLEQILAETLPPKMTLISEEFEKLKGETNKSGQVLSCLE